MSAIAGANASIQKIRGLRNVQVRTLPNGTRIVEHHRPGAKTMDIVISSAGGALRDKPGKEGGAHLLEHMAFEGSPGGRTAREIREQIYVQGGNANAHTTMRHVRLTNTVPNREAREAVDMITHQYTNVSLDPTALAKQKEIVVSELHERLGALDQQAAHEQRRLLFAHPALSESPGGTVSSVLRYTPEDIVEYTGANFTGRNTVVLLSGDRRHFNADVVDAALGRLAKGQRVDVTASGDIYTRGARAEVVPDPTAGHVGLGFSVTHNGKISERQGVASEIVGEILGGGFGSRLQERLRERANITYGVSASSMDAYGNPSLQISTTIAPDDARRAVYEIADELRSLPGTLTGDEVARAQRRIANMHAMSQRGPASPIPGLLEHVQDGEPLMSAAQHAKIAASLTLDEVREAARRLTNLEEAKVFAMGAIGDIAPLQAGMDDAKTGVRLTEVKFDPARYERILAAPPAAT